MALPAEPCVQAFAHGEADICPANIAGNAVQQAADRVECPTYGCKRRFHPPDMPLGVEGGIAAGFQLSPFLKHHLSAIAAVRPERRVAENAVKKAPATAIGPPAVKVAGLKALGRRAFDAVFAPQ